MFQRFGRKLVRAGVGNPRENALSDVSRKDFFQASGRILRWRLCDRYSRDRNHRDERQGENSHFIHILHLP
jgi:hypothetical protein